MLTDTTSVTAAGNADKIRCDACPVMCYIKPGAAGACDRYANHNGELVRVDPHIVLERTVSHGGRLVPFQAGGDWDGKIVHEPSVFVTAIGAGTTYPDYKPAPFIVSSEVDGVDMVTVVTEGIFSYCGVKVKIDTDRHLGPETATVRVQGEAVGHVTTGEYGSQMLSLGGVHHLTGGSKKEGRVTCDALMDLSNCKPVELTIDGGATVVVQAGRPPIVNGVAEERMRVGCGSATIGMFAKQWHGKVDEVVVVDDHITGVLSEHQAGKLLDIADSGIKMKGRRSTPGRYFQVAEPGTGWGGTKISDPLSVLGPFDPKTAHPGMTMLMVSTTGEHAAYYRTRRGAAAGREADAGRSQIVGRAHPGELRTGAVHRAVHGRGRRIAARRRHRQSGAPDPLGEGGLDARHQRRRAGLCLAGGRHHLHGRRHAVAGGRLRLCADAGAGGADRIHDAAVGLRRAWRPYGLRPSAGVAEGQHGNPSHARAVRPGTASMRRAPQIGLLADGRRLHLRDGPIDLIVEAAGARPPWLRPIRPRRGDLPACSMNSAPSCRRCARPADPGAVRCRERSRAACMRRWRRLPPNISSRRWRRSPAPSRRKSSAPWFQSARLGARLCQQWRRHRAASRGRRMLHGWPDRPAGCGGLMRTTVIGSGDPSRGVATSGRHGRSFSLGIADAVTVLAPTASQADAAATIIANAVDLPGHPAIIRCPAQDLQPDSDLGARPVTRDVGALSDREIAEALAAVRACARHLLAKGLIAGAALRLQGETAVVALKISR